MEWLQDTPRPGDPIRVKMQFYYHYGIFISEDRVIQFGLPDDPTRLASDIRVLASDVYTFLQGGCLEVGKPSRQDKKQLRSPAQVIAFAESSLGRDGYSLFHNNCEHFMNECLFGTPTSATVDGLREKLRKKLGK